MILEPADNCAYRKSHKKVACDIIKVDAFKSTSCTRIGFLFSVDCVFIVYLECNGHRDIGGTRVPATHIFFVTFQRRNIQNTENRE